MDRTVSVKCLGREFHLSFSMAVLFDVTEKYDNVPKAVESISNDTQEAFDSTIWLFSKLANEGELCRRLHGYDPMQMINENDLKAEINPRISPAEYEPIRKAVADAIVLGYKNEVDAGPEEIDEGLAELSKKKRHPWGFGRR